MSMNDTPVANRTHIGFFGCRNAGKSSVVNAVTGQALAVVSDFAGTTTDPVYKTMELLPIGPVMICDTPGFDDEGTLGELRVKKTREVINRVDIAVLVIDSSRGYTEYDEQLLGMFEEKEVPCLIVYNKSDLVAEQCQGGVCGVSAHPVAGNVPYAAKKCETISVSATAGVNIYELKEKIASMKPSVDADRPLVRDLVKPGDFVILVTPIDSAAPKGRLILPQQQVIRDLLEAGAVSVVIRETELAETLEKMSPAPALVITDSQAFGMVSKIVPESIPLTSFSILMARYKGFLASAIKGIEAIDRLKPGDKVLIAEGCTHHRQCGDIGSVKLPNWLKQHVGGDVDFVLCSGKEFPDDLSPYKVVIHCGGCMLNGKEMRYRNKVAERQDIPMTNYGTAIAHMKGILERSLEPVR